MKKLVFVFIILCSSLIFSQEIITDNIVKSERIAEFPDGGSQELKFVIERDGSLSNITANGLNESFNKEAIRAISKIKRNGFPRRLMVNL